MCDEIKVHVVVVWVWTLGGLSTSLKEIYPTKENKKPKIFTTH